jgi:hypothetical protein
MSGDYVSTNDTPVVPFSDDEEVRDDELMFDESKAISPEERLTREKKKSERTARLLREGKEAKAEVEKMRLEAKETAARLARLEGYVTAVVPQQPAGPDAYQLALDAVYRKQAEAYNMAQAEIAAKTFTEERGKYYERVAREVETEKARILTRQEMDRDRAGNEARQAQQVWAQKYPEVYDNTRPEIYQYAEATFKRRAALGEKVTKDVVDEIMQETMTTFKVGPKRAPGATERQRMSGIASSGSSGGGPPTGGIVPTPMIRKMATALFSDVSEEEAVKKWINGPGKALRGQKVL